MANAGMTVSGISTLMGQDVYEDAYRLCARVKKRTRTGVNVLINAKLLIVILQCYFRPFLHLCIINIDQFIAYKFVKCSGFVAEAEMWVKY